MASLSRLGDQGAGFSKQIDLGQPHKYADRQLTAPLTNTTNAWMDPGALAQHVE